MSRLVALFLVFLYTMFELSGSAAAAGTSKQNALLASKLFSIALANIDDINLGANYDYNNWKDSPGLHKQGKCDAYDGGHSGIDMQTKDVAGTKTANRIFYSISKGIVINAGGDKYNTISIYDKQKNLSTIYLHARRVDVSLNQNVVAGDQLGVQGDSGVAGSEHVHFEVRKGKYASYACGAGDNTSIDPVPVATSYIANQAQAPLSIITDAFDDNSIDQNVWNIIKGSDVLETNNILQIETNVTDAGGVVLSRWIGIDPGKPLVVQRRVKLHYGNDKYRARLKIEIEGYPGSSFGVSYGNMNYDSGIYCSVVGFYLFRRNNHGGQCAHKPDLSSYIAPVWDRWFDEKILYDPQSGLLDYYIDGMQRASFNVGSLPVQASNRVRLRFDAWGWFTGHNHYIDDLVISQ